MFTSHLLEATIYHPQILLHQILQSIQHLGWIGGIAFILLYICATILLVPGSILTLGAGFAFGVVWGSVYVLIGALIGETGAFLLGRYFVRGWISQKMQQSKAFGALDRAIAREGLKVILLTRLSPIFPFGLLNYAFGVTGISIKDYFLGSVGMIPMTVTYVYLGSLAVDLASIDEATQLTNPLLQWTIKIVGLIATISATLYLTYVARRALDESLKSVVSN